MNPTDIKVITQWVSTGLAVMARILGNDAANITQASISSITGKVMDRRTGTLVATLTVTPADNIFDTLQTDAKWKEDAIGYNFLHVVPASAFPLPGKAYRVGYLFDPLTGENFAFAVDVNTRRYHP